MMIVRWVPHVPIRLADERGITSHADIRRCPISGLETITEPDLVQETDGFILTAYLTNEPSARRRVIWKR